MFWLLLVLQALAVAPEALEEVWRQQEPTALLEDAVGRREVGDFEGARQRLEVLDEGGALGATARYHRAITAELEEHYDLAVELYGQVGELWPDAPEGVDARFRLALCLEDLGHHAESLDLVKGLQADGDWDEHDRVSLALQQGVSELRGGKSRRGLRHIQAALDEVAGSTAITWMRAKARTALARYQLQEAAKIELKSDRRAAKRLAKRAGLLLAAEQQVVAVAQLSEPEYVLEGLVLLGDGYLDLRDALLAARPPKKLTQDQVAVYEQLIAERASVLEAKAWRHFDEGVSLAVRLRWQGSQGQVLADRRAALETPEGAIPTPLVVGSSEQEEGVDVSVDESEQADSEDVPLPGEVDDEAPSDGD